MAVKINLLPAKVHDKGRLAAAWAIVAILLIAELVGLSLFQMSLLDQERKLAQDVQEAKVRADAVNQIALEAQQERQKIASIDQKVTFVQNLMEYNERRPNLYQTTAEYTLEGIRYTSMSASNNLLQVQAWTPTLADAGRYLLYMQNSPDFSQVRISGVPGYPPGGQTGGAAGLGDIGLPGDPGAAPGGPLMSPGPGGFGPGGPGMDAAGMPPGAGGFGPEAGLPGGEFGPGGPGGGFGVGGGGGGRTITGGAYQNSRARNIPPRPPQGFAFTMNAVLVKPITRPIYGGGQQQPGAFGGYGADPYGGAFGPEAGMPGAFGPEGPAGMPPGGMPPGAPGAMPPGMPPGMPGDVAAGG